LNNNNGFIASNLLIDMYIWGDRARYPFKLRGKPLVTIPIVVADIKEIKPQSISTTAVFLCRPIP